MSPSDASTDVGSLSRYHQEEVRRSIQKSIELWWTLLSILVERVGFQKCPGRNQWLQENCIQRLHGLLLLGVTSGGIGRRLSTDLWCSLHSSTAREVGGVLWVVSAWRIESHTISACGLWLQILQSIACIVFDSLMLMPSFLGHHRTETKEVKPKKHLLDTLLKCAKMTYIDMHRLSPDLEDCREKIHWRFLTARTLHVKLTQRIFLQSDQHRNTALISCPCFVQALSWRTHSRIAWHDGRHNAGLCKPCDFKCRSSCRFGYEQLLRSSVIHDYSVSLAFFRLLHHPRCLFCHICGPAESRQWKRNRKSFWREAWDQDPNRAEWNGNDNMHTVSVYICIC